MLKFLRSKFFKRTVYIVLALILLAIPLTYYANRVVEEASEKFIYEKAGAVPHSHVGLLLGTSPVLKNGNVNLYYKYRVDATVQLFREQKIDYLIISGDNSRKEYDEPTEMKKALIAQGVDSTRIFLDYAGFRTHDSVIRSKEIFSQDTIVFISQRFHNERAIYIAQQHGMVAYGYNARDVSTKYGIKTMIREKFARVKVFLDMLFGVKPHFLGEKVLIPE